MSMKKYLIPLIISTALCGAVLAVSQGGLLRPTENNRQFTRKLDPDGAMRQAEQLMKAYQSANGNWRQVDRSLLMLPDQRLAENEIRRNSQSFVTPSANSVYDGQVAFYADLYMRQNLKYEGGDAYRENRSGFYIVGYTNGEIRKVPAIDVRLHHSNSAEHGNIWYHVFPGMTEYAKATMDAVVPKEAAKK